MSTTYSATAYRRLASARRIVRILEKYWEAFQERRKRARLHAALSDLADRELIDIGISRAEIDYVASNPNIDPRGVRSIPPTTL